ncbi:M24 family metallopeptidase [Desulfosarcina ovata]|uniref:Peptidase M24 n=1 Tax=Desulfosarcina ovata subsp. ovata TaxID=2752305 RepID=A0A5K8AFI3_9BACT|nr:Xaa-Pro peptidase family protein [Desulfosarcina ovata]BBO91299.1 peptidase M24 [Desulfosarcina ovata subsp. ovata]
MGRDFQVPADEIRWRQNRLQKQMQEKGIAGLLIVQRVDLFYFSGTSQSGFLYVPAEGQPLLMIKKYLPRARKESSLENIVGIHSIKSIPALIADTYGTMPDVLGLELDVLPVNYFYKLRNLLGVREVVDGSPLILGTRMIKSAWEVEQMRRAAAMSYQTFEYMAGAIRTGLSEIEFTGMYEAFARKQGHGAMLRVRDFLTEGYAWHLLSGWSGGMVGVLDSPASGEGTSAAFPCGAGHKLLAADEPIMIDFSCVLNGYHMDETRMFAIGSMPERAMQACQAAVAIHDAVLDHVKPGVAIGELFDVSVAKAAALGYADQYLGPPGNKVTFIGHGVGLELVEAPIIAKDRKDVLKPGMTLALEPKMVFENEFSAGIEDVFLVTETGYEMVSQVPGKVFVCHPS